VVCSQKVGEDNYTSWTPEDYNARTKVHEYGGGGVFVHNKTVYFSNFKDQQMYSQASSDGIPELITRGDKNWRYADGSFNAKVKLYFTNYGKKSLNSDSHQFHQYQQNNHLSS